MATRRRRDWPDVDWQAMKAACGDRCCHCSRSGPLQRGHIERHADGGPPTIENLIPLCKVCNNKFKDGVTEDKRPKDWRDRFVKNWLRLQGLTVAKSRANTSTDVSYTSAPGQLTEGKQFINFDDLEFCRQNELYSTSLTHTLDDAISAADAQEFLADFYVRAKREGLRPPSNLKMKRELVQQAMRGGKRFQRSAEETLQQFREADDDRKRWSDGWWQELAVSWEDVLTREAEDRKAREAAKAREYEASSIRSDWLRAEAWDREDCKILREAAELPDWPTMTDADRLARDNAKLAVECKIAYFGILESAKAAVFNYHGHAFSEVAKEVDKRDEAFDDAKRFIENE